MTREPPKQRQRRPGAGRKPKPDALTPAQRSARYRERQRERVRALEAAAAKGPALASGVGKLYQVDAALLEQALESKDQGLLTLAAHSVLDGHKKSSGVE